MESRLLLFVAVVFTSLIVSPEGKPCKKACENDIDSTWTQTVKQAEDSVYGETSFMCHSCINNCIQEKMVAQFGEDFDVSNADCDKKNEYYVWHFGTGMVECMEEVGASKCLEQMKFSCGYDYKNMMKTAGTEDGGCKWTEACVKWGFDNSKFQPEDPDWEPYTDEKRRRR